MRKAKVVAIVCGLITSCLIGGFAVVEAATITLDDSSTIETVVYETAAEETTECAATVTFIETTAVTTTSMTVATDSKTPVTTVEPRTTTIPAETLLADDSTTTAIDAIAVIKNTAALPVRATELATEETPAAKATTVATKVTTTTKATTTAPQTTTTVVTTAAPVEEVVLTNPPMPEQPADEVVPEFEIPAIEEAPVEVVQTEAVTEAFVNVPVVEEVSAPVSSVSVSDSDYILLCNAVAHEAGSNSISETDKARVVEVIINRVNSPNYPNTIYGVLTQKNQFSGSSSYVDLTTFSGKVTSKVKAGVDLYFADPSAFNDGYLNFYGDGKQNHFS